MAKRGMGVWAFVLVGVIIVAIAVYSEAQRRQALGPVAKALGLGFSGGPQPLPAEL